MIKVNGCFLYISESINLLFMSAVICVAPIFALPWKWSAVCLNFHEWVYPMITFSCSLCICVIFFIFFFDSLQGSSVCSSYQEGLGASMVGQVPPCTLPPTICVSQVHHRAECPRLSRDITASSIPPWCSLSYRDRSVQTCSGFTAWKTTNRQNTNVHQIPKFHLTHLLLLMLD